MTVVLTLFLLLAIAGAGVLIWWYYPQVTDELRAERSRQRATRLRHRTLANMEKVRELGWIERDRRAREQLRRLMDKYEL